MLSTASCQWAVAVLAAVVAVSAMVQAKPQPENSAGAPANAVMPSDYPPPQYFDAPAEPEYVLIKKADVAPAHWNRLYNDWGKRADQWKNLNHMWGKRASAVAPRWDKRPQPQWNELSGYWGKK